jgi:Ca-activated chloride channel family protein
VLEGVVVEKKAAEERYEDAITAGDAAVMLEQLEPGLYTMNVGNLLPNEDASVTTAVSCQRFREGPKPGQGRGGGHPP